MPKVFIFEPSRLDVSSAESFGEIKYIYDRGEKRTGIWSPRFADDVIDKMKECEYNPQDDHFAVVGNMVPMILIVSQLIFRYEFVNVLLFEAAGNKYTARLLGDIDANGHAESLPKSQGQSCGAVSSIEDAARES